MNYLVRFKPKGQCSWLIRYFIKSVEASSFSDTLVVQGWDVDIIKVEQKMWCRQDKLRGLG